MPIVAIDNNFYGLLKVRYYVCAVQKTRILIVNS
jgi:hypothetical protein